MREIQKMSCIGAIWTLLWGRDVSVCGDSYRVVRRIGEGGERTLDYKASVSMPLCCVQGFPTWNWYTGRATTTPW